MIAIPAALAAVGGFLRPFAPYLLCVAVGAGGMSLWEHSGDLTAKVGPVRIGFSGLGVKLRRHIEADAKALAAAKEKARKTEAKGVTISTETGAKVEKARVEIRTITKTITREIPVVLTPEVDRTFRLPNGLVRLHDAAALGVAPVAGPASQPDDGPSPVAPSQFAGVITDNYGVCHELRAQVVGWREFYSRVQAEWNK
jgi:hypothetical protein